jgi:hypothetical protein
MDHDAVAIVNASASQQLKQETDAEVKPLQDEDASLGHEVGALRSRLERPEKLMNGFVAVESEATLLLADAGRKAETRTSWLFAQETQKSRISPVPFST